MKNLPFADGEHYYLTVNKHDRTQKSPCASLPIDMQHSQYLQETNTPNGACSEYLTIAAQREDDQGCHNNDKICF